MVDFSADAANALFAAQAARTPEAPLLQRSVTARSMDEIDKVAQDFEAMAIAEMMGPMFSELKTDGPLGGGHSEKMYQSMLVQEYAKEVAQAGGIGIADQVRASLIQAQENAQMNAELNAAYRQSMETQDDARDPHAR